MIRSLKRLRTNRTTATIAICGALTACATATPEQLAHRYEPIAAAVDASAAELRARADAGQSTAQYGLSLALRYGLNGLDRNRAAAEHWRRVAVAPRGSTPITTYLAGVNGRSGRMLSILVPRYDLPPVEGALLDRCAEALAAANEAAFNRNDVCGNVEIYLRLKAAWRLASSANASPAA